MTGREKVLQAFEPAGTPEVGVVACYDTLFIRDHWSSLTEVPWWYAQSGAIDREVAWARDVVVRSGLEWLTVRACPSRDERSRLTYKERSDGVWLVDPSTGKETLIPPPTPSGTNTSCASSRHSSLDSLPTTTIEIDALIPLAEPFDRTSFIENGRQDAAVAIRETLDVVTQSHVSSPVWSLYGLLGYEDMMVFLLQDPQLAGYAAERILENAKQVIRRGAALGADVIWIEECLTDQISPNLFRDLNVPLVQQCVHEIRAQGMKSIYYYCGNPNDRFDAIMDVGADAVHFEESKKGFDIDIADVVRKVDRRCVVFGNLDAIGVLEAGSDDALRAEIERQLEAGKDNGNRFVMSTGSPITPGTPVKRVRLYTDITRELSKQ